MRRLGCFWGVSLAVILVGWMSVAAAEETLARRLPPRAVGSVEVINATALLDRVQESELLKTVLASPEYRKWADSTNGRKFRGGRAVLEGQLGMNTWDASRRIFGHRAIAAVYPPAEGSVKPQAILLIHLADEEVGPHLRKQFEPWADVLGDELRAEQRDDGWFVTAKDGTTACLTGSWLAAATSDPLLREVRARLTSEDGTSLADLGPWQTPSAAVSADETRVEVRVDLERIREATNKPHLLPEKLDNPLGSLLLGAIMEAASRGSGVNGSLTITPGGFDLQVKTSAAVAELGAGHQALLATLPAANDLTPAVPRQLAGFTLCRDWMTWYQRREELLIERILPEFDKFETGLSTFLPGKDFAQDVLGKLNAPLSFVAAEQTYAHLTTKPGLQLPAFAVVLDLRNPQEGADLFRLFFQTLATIVNIEAGKQGRQPWVMDSENHRGVQVSFAKYLELPQGDELPMVFNFQPAAGLVGHRFVMASSLELCRDLIDSLQTDQRVTAGEATPPARNLELSLDPVVAAELLQANRAVLTAKGVQDGKSIEQAERELDYLLNYLRTWSPWRLTTNVLPDGLELNLRGALK